MQEEERAAGIVVRFEDRRNLEDLEEEAKELLDKGHAELRELRRYRPGAARREVLELAEEAVRRGEREDSDVDGDSGVAARVGPDLTRLRSTVLESRDSDTDSEAQQSEVESNSTTAVESDSDSEASDAEAVRTTHSTQNMSSRRTNGNAGDGAGRADPPRRGTRRTHDQAFDDAGSEADSEAVSSPAFRAPGSSRRRTRVRATTATNNANAASTPAEPRAESSRTARPQNEPIVIDDLDSDSDENLATFRMRETLQRQREEQVRAQQQPPSSNANGEAGAEEQPKLSKLQCVICMDSFTDMTATSCGRSHSLLNTTSSPIASY